MMLVGAQNMSGAARLGDLAQVRADAHGCPACPHPGVGPITTGSSDVFINGRPAARQGDLGLHAICCGPCTFKIAKGSHTVYVNGKPLARRDDKTQHCGGNGPITIGSPDVIVDDGAQAAVGLAGFAGRALQILLDRAGSTTPSRAGRLADANAGKLGGRGAGDLASDLVRADQGPAAGAAAPPPSASPTVGPFTLEVTVVDPRGQPRAKVEWKLAMPDGGQRSGTTGADGLIKEATTAAGLATLELFEASDAAEEEPAAPPAPGPDGPPTPQAGPVDPPPPGGDVSIKQFFGRLPGATGREEQLEIGADDDIELAWEVEGARSVRLFRVTEGVAGAQPVPAPTGLRASATVKPGRTTSFLLFALKDDVEPEDGAAPAPRQAPGPTAPTVTAQVVPQLRNLAFLDHFVPSGTGVASMTAAALDPHFVTATSGGLQGRIAALLQAKPQYLQQFGLQFSVSDLTKDPDQPELAGSKLDEHWETASSGKIMIMYAAFQLQFDLNALAQKNPDLQTSKDLFALARREWGKTQARIEPPTPIAVAPGNAVRLELAGKLVLRDGKPIAGPTHSAPQLEKIFEVRPGSGAGAPARVQFIRDPRRQSNRQIWDKVSSVGAGAITGLTFFERACLMIDESSNEATTSVEQELGFLYMNSVLWQSGLYDPARGGGMWMGRFYPKGNAFIPAPVPSPTPKTPDGAEIFAGTTARSYAAFMALLAQGRLVDAASSAQMKELMDRRMVYGAAPTADKPKTLNRGPAGDALAGTQHPRVGNLDELYDKIGIGGRNNIWCVALVKRRTAAGKQLHYTVAVLDSVARGKEDGLLSELVRDLDGAIDRNNP